MHCSNHHKYPDKELYIYRDVLSDFLFSVVMDSHFFPPLVTLNLKKIMSPSWTTYVFPSCLYFPAAWKAKSEVYNIFVLKTNVCDFRCNMIISDTASSKTEKYLHCSFTAKFFKIIEFHYLPRITASS